MPFQVKVYPMDHHKIHLYLKNDYQKERKRNFKIPDDDIEEEEDKDEVGDELGTETVPASTTV
jgi:hypothetical protein